MELYDFQTLEQELKAYEQMSETMAMNVYRVDSKEEALSYILDWWA